MEGIISVEDKIILEQQSSFYLERLFEKLRIPYEAATVLLTSVFVIQNLVVTFFTGELMKNVISWWFPAGVLSPILIMLFLKYLRDKTIDSVLRIKPMIDPERWKSKYLDRYFKLIFASKYQIVAIVGGITISILYNYYVYYFGFWPYSNAWLLTNIIGGMFFYPLCGFLVIFCVGVAIICYNVGRHVHLKEEYVFSHDKMANLKPLATLGIINALAWALPIGLWLPGVVTAKEINPLLLMGAIIFIIATLALFMFPIYSLHRGMVHMKNTRLAEINRRILELKEKSVKGDEPIEKLQLQFEIEKTIFDEVRSMKVWPIDWSTVLKMVGTLVVSVIPLILKYLLPTLQYLPS
ncbi:MAG: hypothetical protein ACTSP1_01735 [Candidatus Freyarchaeota archaeon]